VSTLNSTTITTTTLCCVHTGGDVLNVFELDIDYVGVIGKWYKNTPRISRGRIIHYSMLSALYAIARPSVRMSVRLSRVDQSQTVEIRIMKR